MLLEILIYIFDWLEYGELVRISNVFPEGHPIHIAYIGRCITCGKNIDNVERYACCSLACAKQKGLRWCFRQKDYDAVLRDYNAVLSGFSSPSTAMEWMTDAFVTGGHYLPGVKRPRCPGLQIDNNTMITGTFRANDRYFVLNKMIQNSYAPTFQETYQLLQHCYIDCTVLTRFLLRSDTTPSRCSIEFNGNQIVGRHSKIPDTNYYVIDFSETMEEIYVSLSYAYIDILIEFSVIVTDPCLYSFNSSLVHTRQTYIGVIEDKPLVYTIGFGNTSYLIQDRGTLCLWPAVEAPLTYPTANIDTPDSMFRRQLQEALDSLVAK